MRFEIRVREFVEFPFAEHHTPLTQVTLEDPEIGPLMREVPMPIGRWAEPAEIAAAARWMLSAGSSFMVGSVLFVDGGTDALVRPDSF